MERLFRAFRGKSDKDESNNQPSEVKKPAVLNPKLKSVVDTLPTHEQKLIEYSSHNRKDILTVESAGQIIGAELSDIDSPKPFLEDLVEKKLYERVIVVVEDDGSSRYVSNPEGKFYKPVGNLFMPDNIQDFSPTNLKMMGY
ncbi:MAG TPA: hypothetical protein VK338_05200 [Candidatus Nitrosocosmicus sp.]|nr:hypothetical protein [Candidatus Nitrosocosmicus sp.]